MLTKKPVVSEVIAQLGGPSEAARKLGIGNPSVILNWRQRGNIPAAHVLAIEAITGVSRHDMRPDIFGEKPEHAA